MANAEYLYRVQFISNGERYQVFVRDVRQGDLWGFVELVDFVWRSSSTLVIDTAEERLKTEFAGVDRTLVPLHHVLRIDRVTQRGDATITALSDKITPFPGPLYPPGRSSS